MKIPFVIILGPILKPYFSSSRLFCQHPTFTVSVPYTYVYSALGVFINVHKFIHNLGKLPLSIELSEECHKDNRNNIIAHDLKIIAISIGFFQYSCLLAGCVTTSHKEAFGDMETESDSHLLESIRRKHENNTNMAPSASIENNDCIRVKLRALLVALLGLSMSACAFASQPTELELDDDEVNQRLSNVSFARRITKPTIRLVMGYGKLSAFVTASTSLLLLVAVMSKQSWWRRGARWLVLPALLVTALEIASDTSDALLAAILRGSAEPALLATQIIAACFMITVEILVWYFIAKFFEHNQPTNIVEVKKETRVKPMIPNIQ